LNGNYNLYEVKEYVERRNVGKAGSFRSEVS
jgi:hypothetical protein